ncbi:hypothetical protein D3C75_1146390 [compost metagenome]
MRGKLVGVEHKILTTGVRNGLKNDPCTIDFKNEVTNEPTGRFDTFVEANLSPVAEKVFPDCRPVFLVATGKIDHSVQRERVAHQKARR